MVHNNKVLTVSYGTFSCTLEGFEDSFDTMKAIAEYFRDLAADDRYFGAEPPQPDADMLARIAQREVARQVEARTSDQGIHLRAASALAPAAPEAAETQAEAPVAAAPAQAEPEVAEPEVAEAATVETPVEPLVETPTDIAPQEDTAAEAPEDTPSLADESGAVELFEAPADDAPLEDAVAQDAGDIETIEELAVEAIEEDAEADEAAQASFEGSVEGSDAEAAAWGADAALVDASEASDEDHIIFPEAEPEATPVAESIAAKLQRIRAVVAKAPSEDENFNEDQHAEVFATPAAAPETVTAEDEAGADEQEPDISAILDKIATDGEAAEATQEAAEDAVVSAEDTDIESDLEATAALIAETVQDDADVPAAEEVAADQAVDTPDEMDAVETTVAPTEAAEVTEEAPQAPPVQRRPRGRVIRVRRAAAAPDLVEATATEISADTPVEDLPRPEPTEDATPAAEAEVQAPVQAEPTSLSDDDEADLLAELAAVEADLKAASRADVTAADEAEDVTEGMVEAGYSQETAGLDDSAAPLEDLHEEETPVEARPAAALLQRSPGALEGDLSRLMAEADDKLEQADTASSRETYNQLRAAVAAAQAEGNMDDSAEKEAQAEAFRQDLESVVRPRRPMRDAGSETAPSQEAPRGAAPLKLVAEQRIDPEPADQPAEQQTAAEADAPAPQEAPMVRPRRVSSAMLGRQASTTTGAPDTGFAEFVRDQGAVELGELLEAAAAYMTKVEGREQFTRPQLLGKVRGLDDQTGLTREDSLRAFGQLLRDGKLDKASNGRFTTNSQTGFQSGDRAAS